MLPVKLCEIFGSVVKRSGFQSLQPFHNGVVRDIENDAMSVQLRIKRATFTAQEMRGNYFTVDASLSAKIRRWWWRKHGCQQGLWMELTRQDLYERWGLFRLPGTAPWKPRG
jgi:hypothetical protein